MTGSGCHCFQHRKVRKDHVETVESDQLSVEHHAMAVGGLYIAYRIRRMVLPFVRVYGQWVEERIIPMSEQLQKMAETVEQETYDDLMSQPADYDYAGDGSDEAEAAHDIGLSFYEDISKMYQATLNLSSAGLFHVVEQQLADLTRDGAIEKKASETPLKEVIEWYKKGFQLARPRAVLLVVGH
jgi:hypothetical protein